MIQYVDGFLFNDKCDWVILLLKARPTWQVGLLNGVGGKVEGNEYHRHAMERESIEEIGVTPGWQYFLSLETSTRAVHFYCAKDQQAFDKAKAQTDEPVVRTLVQNIATAKTVPILNFLVPMAQYKLTTTFVDPERLYIGAFDA